MKNTMLLGVLLTLVGTQVQAEATQPVTNTQTPTTTTTNNANQPAGAGQNPTDVQNVQSAPVNQTTPTTPTTTQQTQPATTSEQGQISQTIPTPPVPAVINCDYKIPASIKTIEQSTVLTWSEKATTQAFDFDPAQIDTQLTKLQNCFTDQGWASFSTALQKSGNLDAIKSQKLTVSSQVDGQAQVTEAKGNQWKVTLPLQVVYQNDKEKVTQLLDVNLVVGRKITGDLGIMQMIATPHTSVAQQQNPNATNQNNTVAPAATGTDPQNSDANTTSQTPTH